MNILKSRDSPNGKALFSRTIPLMPTSISDADEEHVEKFKSDRAKLAILARKIAPYATSMHTFALMICSELKAADLLLLQLKLDLNTFQVYSRIFIVAYVIRAACSPLLHD
jgi:hypothetical protein